MAIVATVGTTSSTSADPVTAIADVATREGIWLHVDAAYAGVVAMLPERRAPFAGWDRADSIVVNPHKWLFTPLDASLLLTRRMDQARAAFSLVPEYLRTLDRTSPVLDYNEYQPQLGRRMRALKLWMLIRWFGLDGLRRRIDFHLELAARFATWVDEDPAWERLAPVPFSTVCFRYRPTTLAGREDEGDVPDLLDDLNTRLMDAVNRTGEVFLSHTRLRDRFTIRLAIGNLHTRGTPRRAGVGAAAARGRRLDAGADRGAAMTEPIEILYFYRTRWGAHDEFVELFERNHWPILREQLAAGRYTNVELSDAAVPRRGPRGLGRAGLDHVPRLGRPPGAQRRRDRRAAVSRPGPRSSAEEQQPVRAARRPLGRRARGALPTRLTRAQPTAASPHVACARRIARGDDVVRDHGVGLEDAAG